MKKLFFVIAFFILLQGLHAQWQQWGGEKRDFKARGAKLSDSWPEGGPAEKWKRQLGEGYSAVLYDKGILYTMYRKKMTDDFEFTVALDAETGKTVWEHRIEAFLKKPVKTSGWGGNGPNSTPVIEGKYLYSVGSLGKVHCYDKKSGKVIWSHYLYSKNNKPELESYCYSPIVYGKTIILLAKHNSPDGKANRALVALDLKSGKKRWESLKRFKTSFSSPIIIKFKGKDYLVYADHSGLTGMNPLDGKVIWHHPVGGSIITPVWNGKDMILYSSGGGNAPCLVVKLEEKNGKIVPGQIWKNRKVALWQPTPVVVGKNIYGGSTKKLTCGDFATGALKWSEKEYPMACCVYGDGKLITLDEDGNLTLLRVSGSGMNVLGKCKVTVKYSFTVPTLVGSTLYVRDRKHIMALKVGK